MPIVSNPTASFRLPSGSTTSNRRREPSRTDAASPYWLGLPPGLRMPHAGRTMPPRPATRSLQRHGVTKRRRQHARALALNDRGSRSRSPLRRTTVADPATGSGTPSSNASRVPIDAIREALKMTKIRDTPDPSSHTSRLTSPRPASPQPRVRAGSDPGPYGTLETVTVTKHRVP